MPIDKSEVRRIARLASLEYPRVQDREGNWIEPEAHLFDDALLERLAADLSGILDHVRSLDAVDVTGVEPTRHGVPVETRLRKDEPEPWPEPEALLEGVPERVENAISVPRIVE